MFFFKSLRAIRGLPLLLLLAHTGSGSGRANLVLDWNATMLNAIRIENSSPTLSTRNLAILNLALHDAISSVTLTHQPYQRRFSTPPGTSFEAAAAAAGYGVLQVLYPGVRARTEEVMDVWRRAAPSDLATTNGLILGRAVARATLTSRENDGSATEVPYIPSHLPGQWRRTPPSFRPPLTPHWRYVKPFALPELPPFVPGPPPPLDSVEYALDLNEVRRWGASDSPVRTDEQSLIAMFWSDFSYTGTPPGHWHEIAATIAQNRITSLPETARLMALLSLAHADAAIVCWEAKYRYNLWRPVTAIQRAAEDGNPHTDPDLVWDHYLAAPPFPAYPSGHSTFSAAAAHVLALFFGTDAITFTIGSDAMPGVVRTYDSLAACAAEVGVSRIYGGIHFPFDDRAGKATGQRVAEYVFANYLLAESALPQVRLEEINAPEGIAVCVHGRLGVVFVLEASSDLLAWTPVATGTGTAGGTRMVVSRPDAAAQFYRAGER